LPALADPLTSLLVAPQQRSDTQNLHYPILMEFDYLGENPQFGGNFLAHITFGQQSYDLYLPFG
jgi:hypothetical protein